MTAEPELTSTFAPHEEITIPFVTVSALERRCPRDPADCRTAARSRTCRLGYGDPVRRPS